MKKYDYVKLKNGQDNLTAQGITVGTKGEIAGRVNDGWLVMFNNPYDMMDYAVGVASEENLELLHSADGSSEQFFDAIIARKDFLEHTKLAVRKLREYDCVELVTEKPEYTREGVRKGMRGCVMAEYACNGKWGVIFSERYTGKDIADIDVHEDDVKVVDKF